MRGEANWHMNHKGAIFDMDGLMFDTEKVFQQTWHEIADENGVKLSDKFVKDISGTNGEYMCHVIEKHYGVADGSIIMKDCMSRVRKKLEIYVPKKKGIDEILDFFQKKHVKLAVASSSSKEQIRQNLVNSELEKYFDEIVSGTDVKHGKPEPDIFLLAAEKIGCRPQDCYVFEDSENGIRAGVAAGCITVMVPDLISPSEQIREICGHICDDLIEAINILNNDFE
ncbi:HAD family phosphatase [Eubacterium sp. MSJ-13]|uniref:HAD family hydrolase n=1 Tax=Eubacterium sp. MSJ-13 TaxID=2841513 RepID=UPI001C0F6904|nr:HAD family phosphatase [Eubacterium sp. MSJ-13]MBU5477910.1 HAD family phosphatase [Eubacterium sp. MSJ-13]